MSEEFRKQLIDFIEEEIALIENCQHKTEFDAGYLGAMTNALDFIQGQDVYFTYLNSLEEEEAK
jgi:hypothetical protein